MNDSAQRLPFAVGGIAAVACLGFAAVTGHMWEDYFITFRASLNLASGHGLVFQPGERVHTFTSPLGTLLPALFALGGGEDVAVRALWLFRCVSAAALGGALGLAARVQQRAGLAPLAIGAAGVAWSIDPKTVDFSINGMESALLILFIVLTWRAFATGAQVLPCALALAGLQWTRPDGCVFFGVLGLGWLAFGGAAAPGLRDRILLLIRAVALGIALYLPWLLFAWWYYGSPIPHTVMAKISHHAPGELLPALILYPGRLLFGHVALHDVFMPTYFFFGGWPPALAWIARFLAVVPALAWLWPRVPPAGRVASTAFFLGGFYVEYIPRSPWYYPGWQALGFLAWAYVLHAACRGAVSRPARDPELLVRADVRPDKTLSTLARVTAGVLVTVQAGLFVATAVQMRAQQAVIENGHRTQIGRWLRAEAGPADRVYLEPLGYIGFFSGLKMLDYPGLSSPEVVAARRAGHSTHARVIAALRPEWLVLRPDQVQSIQTEAPQLLSQEYRLARLFDARAAVDAITFLPGRGYLEFDALYLVFRRGPAPPS